MGYFDEALAEKENSLEHGAWKNHKYIRKDGKKYIYKETRDMDDGTSQDIYENEETGETIHKNNNFKYDPERPDYRKKVQKKTEETVDKLTDKKDPETGEMTKADYIDKDKENEKKYFVKHFDVELGEDELAHSSGPWKKHKYFQKIGQGANAVYKYTKKAVGYAYGSEYRKDMDKYHDVEDRAQANMWKANEDNWKLKNKIEDNAKNGGPNAVINGKALRKEKERNQEYFDKEYAKAQEANNRYGNAGTKYYNSLAYKVEKATGAYDKGRAERAHKKGYEGLAERHEEAYKKSAGYKTQKVKDLAKDTVKRGANFIKNLLTPQETVTMVNSLGDTTKTVIKNKK